MKILKNVIDKYIELCPLSSSKCADFAELEYKILRCVELGNTLNYNDGICTVRYYHLNFLIGENVVYDMYEDVNSKLFLVGEKIKQKHYQIHNKVMV